MLRVVLVTGGAGCIESNLVRALLKADPEKTIVIDDLSTACEWNLLGVKELGGKSPSR